ncbi:murinoglobulin-2-like isoform X2 [Aethina tumida]|uniref:murinoglobulin-2-like isoform X2 n=1 Tax=Aethina tumida TaxID=116153 RepID=UPI0021477194|nr:murinoglobulin-2-like isoform X2 [Aethina tumida]
MWIRVLLLFLIKCALVIHGQERVAENRYNKDRGFLLTMPKTLINGKNESVCLSLHSFNFPTTVIVDLKWKDEHFSTNNILKTDYTCFPLYVPLLPIEDPQFVKVKVNIQNSGTLTSSRNQDPILLYPHKANKTFIETDRYIYKPGDTIKIRLLTINNDLLPQSGTINEIKIKNPLDVTVAIWENLKANMGGPGIIQFEYLLLQESITGKWKIEMPGETVYFLVEKYVLPKFQVEVDHPKTVYFEEESVQLKVCGKYSYGKNVNGYGLIKVIDSHSNMQTLYKTKRLTDGCTDFVITRNELNLENINSLLTSDPKIYVHITATVTEYGTNRMQMAMVKCLVVTKPYNLKFVGDSMFLPGLPYKGKLQFFNVHIGMRSQMFEICYNFAINKSWNYLNNEQCSNYTMLDNQRFIEFNILPLQSRVIHIHLTARSLNNSEIFDSFLVLRQHSLSNRYFSIEGAPNNNACNTHQTFRISLRRDKFATKENVAFYYMIKSRHQLHHMGKYVYTVRNPSEESEEELKNIIGDKHKFNRNSPLEMEDFTFTADLKSMILSSYQILIYHITKGGEVIAASRHVELEPCLQNKVNAKWLHKQLYPGSTAALLLNVSSDSICSISAIDKSVSFLENHNKKLDVHKLLSPFLKEKPVAETNRRTCIPPNKKQARHISYTEDEQRHRSKRHVFPFSEDYDSFDVFNKLNTIVISNLKIITKPCYTVQPQEEVQYITRTQTDEYEEQNEETTLSVRSYFPETWLWDLVKVEKNKPVKEERILPHTITNWKTNVMCVSATDGIGFSQEIEISAFQPFFVDVVTPYSVKREEYFYVPITVFNYLNYSLPIRIKLEYTDNLESDNSIGNLSHCVTPNATINHVFNLKALTTGSGNITVLTEVDTDFPSKCGPDSVVNKRDIVQKSIIIEPEGYPVKITKSALLCGSGERESKNISWEISTPDDIVSKTAKAYVAFNGDILGPAIENLENLLSIPMGCGEQVMASVAPNLYVMRYLEATGKLTTSMRQRITRNLKIGYQRILNYAHRDGSFSAFGYHDSSGSMFLTAFVVKTLQEAKKYVYVDQRVINKAVNWIFKHQLENGCFNAMLHVFQDMGGTSMENSTAGLTAYVILSLEEANIPIPTEVKTNAKYCIRSLNNPDKYSLAISCYALFKVSWISEASRMLNRLMLLGHQHQNMMWWSVQDEKQSTATDLELTGYVLKALLHQNSDESLANAHSAVRWLVSKQGPHGGFKTTQDTVVVLDALTKYAALINENKLDLKIKVSAKNQHYKFSIQSEEKIKSKRVPLRATDNEILVEISGKGCILAQVVSSYYLKHAKKSEAFKLHLDIAPVSNVDPCSITSLSPCLAYMGPDTQSNMAVLEVTLPSGYSADRASLYKLVEAESKSKVKMFEEIKNQVVLYLTKLSNEQVCITFNINENTLVETRKDSIIKLYDYYKPEYESVQFYHMNKECLINNTHLPEITESPNKKIINFTNDYIEDSFAYKNVNKAKRERRHIDSKKKSNLNPDFVDMDMDMATPNGVEGNRPVYVKAPKNMTINKITSKIRRDINRNRLKKLPSDHNRQKRQIKSNLNPNFVDMDMEMATPNGMEGNVPTYIKPSQSLLKNMTKASNVFHTYV